MVSAELLVERGSYTDKSENWGNFGFLGLPSPGDRIAVAREGATHYLTVLCVHHRPTNLADGAGEPSAHVVAKWTGQSD